MKIVVCIKQISQTYAQTGMDVEHHYLSSEDHILRINPYDEAALEIALKEKDKNPDVEIFLLTLGPILAEGELRRCLALGADHLYQIDQNASLGSWEKARIIARVLKDLNPDLVLCGKESMDQQNGQIGTFLANFIDLPFVSAIDALEISFKNQTVEVKRACGRGVREIIESSLPAVFSVDMGAFEFRMPRLKEQEKADTKAIHQIIVLPEEQIEATTLVSTVFPPCPRTKRIHVPCNHLKALDRIQQLLTGSRMEKNAQMLDGSPESQVEGIIDFLKEHDFIKA